MLSASHALSLSCSQPLMAASRLVSAQCAASHGSESESHLSLSQRSAHLISLMHWKRASSRPQQPQGSFHSGLGGRARESFHRGCRY
ncbi:hypothetical protein CYLTODRAFT_120153 [Cylindrobasidium torrendii FP15055 ss-10]|uniref:Uncharacterized protein n=1 Tax=Cylindrobasidium torrendii FP15055 ss-10 TaxID=1314674 RepID=A0A0D7B2Z6_9AGAR|nr:hypothetical protein CYLTODRAFT_120153 [Cylindrobasidium torrendii FP15055 ss-10]